MSASSDADSRRWWEIERELETIEDPAVRQRLVDEACTLRWKALLKEDPIGRLLGSHPEEGP